MTLGRLCLSMGCGSSCTVDLFSVADMFLLWLAILLYGVYMYELDAIIWCNCCNPGLQIVWGGE
jgi:hypothetical protein